MQHKWKDMVNGYFAIASNDNGVHEVGRSDGQDNKSEEVKIWLRNKLIKKVGTSVWYNFPLQVISILIAAISFSKIFGNNGIVLSDENVDEEYDKGIQALNNLIFTVSTSLSHSILQYTNGISKNCEKNSNLYLRFKQTVIELDETFAENKPDLESQSRSNRELTGNIVASALEKALTIKGVKGLGRLNDYRVTEYTLNMLIAFNTYLLNQGSEKPASFTSAHADLIAEEFAEIIASTMNKRSYASNLVRAHKPNHTQLKLTPSIENFLIIIDEVMTKNDRVKESSYNSIYSSKQHEPFKEKASSENESKSSAKGKTILSYNSDTEDAEVDISEEGSRYSNEFSATDYDASEEPSNNTELSEDEKSESTEKNNNSFKNNLINDRYKKIIEDSKRGSQSLNFSLNQGLYHKYWKGSGVAQGVYKVFCSASASFAIYNPFIGDDNYSVLYRYLLACGSLLTSYAFYKLYVSVKNVKTNEGDIYDREREVVANLYDMRLITKSAENEYSSADPVKQIEKIVSNVYEKLSKEHHVELDEKNRAKALVVTYTALASVLISRFDENQKFKFSESDIINISSALASKLAEMIEKKPQDPKVVEKSQRQNKLINNIYERSLISVIKAELDFSNEINRWSARVSVGSNVYASVCVKYN